MFFRFLGSLRSRAEHGDPKAQYELATHSWRLLSVPEHGEDPSTAMKWYRMAAEEGHKEAQYELGNILNSGSNGVPQDYAESLKWFRRAGAQGHLEAQYKLARIYFNGMNDVQEDMKEGLRWLHRAAKKNHKGALCALGILHEGGIGVPKNWNTAKEWYQKANGNYIADGILYHGRSIWDSSKGDDPPKLTTRHYSADFDINISRDDFAYYCFLGEKYFRKPLENAKARALQELVRFKLGEELIEDCVTLNLSLPYVPYYELGKLSKEYMLSEEPLMAWLDEKVVIIHIWQEPRVPELDYESSKDRGILEKNGWSVFTRISEKKEIIDSLKAASKEIVVGSEKEGKQEDDSEEHLSSEEEKKDFSPGEATQTSRPNFCSACGTPAGSEHNYCEKCGNKLI